MVMYFFMYSRVSLTLWARYFSKIQGAVALSSNLLFIGSMTLGEIKAIRLVIESFKKY